VILGPRLGRRARDDRGTNGQGVRQFADRDMGEEPSGDDAAATQVSACNQDLAGAGWRIAADGFWSLSLTNAEGYFHQGLAQKLPLPTERSQWRGPTRPSKGARLRRLKAKDGNR
jgi:hypothetical protein